MMPTWQDILTGLLILAAVDIVRRQFFGRRSTSAARSGCGTSCGGCSAANTRPLIQLGESVPGRDGHNHANQAG